MAFPNVFQLRDNIKRFDEIVRVLAKYGLAEWISEDTPGIIRRRFVTEEGVNVADLPFAVRLRLALTELGTTFIKLGQMLSTRADIVGPEVAAELSSLQADTPADPPDAVRAMLESELGLSVEEIFAEFDYNALASASVGQVHLATLMDGMEVVVKVQHAGIEDKVRGDLSILTTLAGWAEKNSKELAMYKPSATVAEFRRSLLRELDFGIELANMGRFSRSFADFPAVHFPIGYSAYSSQRVLIMELLHGRSVAYADDMRAEGLDLVSVADVFADSMLKMIFQDGFYHADPHPGNVFLLDDGRLGFLDCGKVGRVDEQSQEEFINIVQAFMTGDSERLSDELIQMCDVPPDFDRSAYTADIAEFVGEYRNQQGAELEISRVFTDMFSIIRRYHLGVPPRVSMLLIVIGQLEGTARLLDPEFNLTEAMGNYRNELIWKRFSPDRLMRRTMRVYRDYDRLFRTAPRDLLNILDRLEHGELKIQVQQNGIDTPANRLVYAIIISALILASSALLATSAPPTLWNISVFGFLMMFGALLMSAYLFIAILKSGKL